MKSNTKSANANGISEDVLKLAEEIKKELKVGEGGIVEAPKDLYQRTLPENISMADVERIDKHNGNVIAALGLAVGELGLERFKKDKKIDQLSCEIGAGKNKGAVVFQREKTFPNGQGGTITKHGVLSAKWQTYSAGNRGMFQKVRVDLSERAAAAAKA